MSQNTNTEKINIFEEEIFLSFAFRKKPRKPVENKMIILMHLLV